MRISAGSAAKAAAISFAALGLWSCTVSVEEPRPSRPDPGPRICTREYDPVCGERYGDRQTFANSCLARADGYRVVSGGQCRGDRPDRPDRPHRPDRPDRPDRPGQAGSARPANAAS